VTPPSNAGPPPAKSSWAPRALSVSRAAAEEPLPWLVAAIVFVANAMLSASRGEWWLAALEVGTGVLACISAASVASRRSATRHQATTGDAPDVGGPEAATLRGEGAPDE
jgi:hypothetical protein